MRKAMNPLILSFVIVFVSYLNEKKQDSTTPIHVNNCNHIEATKEVPREISVVAFNPLYVGVNFFVHIDLRSALEC